MKADNMHKAGALKAFMKLMAVCLSLLTLVYWLTAASIQENQINTALTLIKVLVPSEFTDQLNQQTLSDLKQNGRSTLGSGCNRVNLYQTEAQGYSGQIQVISSFSVTAAGTELIGARVIPPHKETPGLGDIIAAEISDWIFQFDRQKLDNGFDPDKYDTVSGATISTSAVIKAIHKADTKLMTEQENKDDC